MIWKDTVLVGAPVPTAFDPATGILAIGSEELRFVSDTATDVRAVAADGRSYRLVKRSMTTSRYEAICGSAGDDGRRYTARRTGGHLFERRRDITDVHGELVAETRGLPNGDLELIPAAEETAASLVDFAFISWGLTYVDAPTRRTLY